MSPATAGEDHTGRWVARRHSSRPLRASTAWRKRSSELPAYTTPSANAGEVLTQDI